jgi:hypothetical protein
MAALVTQKIVKAGTKPTLVPASASDTAEVGNGVNTFLVYKNTNAATRTVTIAVPGDTDYGEPLPDPTYTLAATTGELWIPLRKDFAVDGRATVTVTPAVTDVTVAVVRVE